MFKKLFPNRKLNIQAHATYNAIVEKARNPKFYLEPYGVEDTVEGRFELILLHLFLTDREMAQDGIDVAVRRTVREILVKDMDRSLREMGIGDMSISKQMKKVGAALIARLASIEAVFDKDSENDRLASLVEILDRNVDFSMPEGALHLAKYLDAQVTELSDKNETSNR